MASFPGLVFVEVDGKVMARNQPVEGRPPLDAETLRELLQQAGFGALYFHDDVLATLLAQCNAPPAEFEMPVGERRDAQFTVELAPDDMSALVHMVPAMGGKAVPPDEIVSMLKKNGVVFGISEPAVQLACEATEPGQFVVANGIEPLQGEDTRFEPLVEIARDRAPRVNEQGLIDFRDQGEIPMVEAGVPLMRRIPATPGAGGRNVRGKDLPAVSGHDVPFGNKTVGALVSLDDPNLLCSTMRGQPVDMGNGVSVEPVLTVKNVNLATGNITFDGSVTISGDVLAGMKVNVTGDIMVGGIVEGGELEAGGNIQVSGGIIAHAKVRAAGAVSARFVENSKVYSGTVISISDMAMQSELEALNQIEIGLKSPQRGRMLGGSAKAMMLVSAPLFGSAGSGLTSVQVGVNPELGEKYEAVKLRIEKQDAAQASTKKLIAHLTQNGDKNNMLEHAKTSWKHSVQVLAQLIKEKNDLEKEIARLEEARVLVVQGVEGSLDLAFGSKQVRHVRRIFDAGTFTAAGAGKVIFTDRRGLAVPVA